MIRINVFANPYVWMQNGALDGVKNTKSLGCNCQFFLNYKPCKLDQFLNRQFATHILALLRFGGNTEVYYKNPSRKLCLAEFNPTMTSEFRLPILGINIVDFDCWLFNGHNLKNHPYFFLIWLTRMEGSDTQTRNFDTDAYLFIQTTQAGTDYTGFMVVFTVNNPWLLCRAI